LSFLLSIPFFCLLTFFFPFFFLSILNVVIKKFYLSQVLFVSNFVNPLLLYMNHQKPLSFSFFFKWPSQVPTKPTTYVYLLHLQLLGGRL
jgi:hypothetical protein